MFRQLRLFTMLLIVVSLIGTAGPAGFAAAATPPPPDVGPEGIVIPVPPPPLPDVFLHTSQPSNITNFWTGITHPDSGLRPGNVAFATHNFSGPGAVGPYHNIGLGVTYVSSRWNVFNQNSAAMANPVHFNVMIAPPSASVYTHTVTAENTGTYITTLDQPLANDNPNALVFITPRHTSVKFNEPLGVYYRGTDDRWTVFSQDISEALPLSLRINVYVTQAGPRTFVHTATPANTANNNTLIDHPLTNNNRFANVIVTQNYNPGGGGGVYNENHVGVFYDTSSGKWGIFNENLFSAMPNGASFNVMVGKPKLYLPFVIR